jgi:putative pyruvate formate lyase activating enzyme
MAQFHPDNSVIPQVPSTVTYAQIARRPWRCARELGLKFETASFERCNAFGM